jgi:hypothetical protein
MPPFASEGDTPRVASAFPFDRSVKALFYTIENIRDAFGAFFSLNM